MSDWSHLRPEQIALLRAERLLVVDLECTCGPGITHDIQEIIEVGYCLADGGNVPLGSSMYVRPEITAVTPFCTKLTGITPATVSHQPSFQRRMQDLARELEALRPDAWASWGEFDHQMVARQCARIRVDNPLSSLPHFNAKKLLSPVLCQIAGAEMPRGAKGGIGLDTAMTMVGLEFIGRLHRGADDAHNTARLICHARSRVPTPQAPHPPRFRRFRPG